MWQHIAANNPESRLREKDDPGSGLLGMRRLVLGIDFTRGVLGSDSKLDRFFGGPLSATWVSGDVQPGSVSLFQSSLAVDTTHD